MPWVHGRAALPVVVLELLVLFLFVCSDHFLLRLCTYNVKPTWPQMFCVVMLQAAVVPGSWSTYCIFYKEQFPALYPLHLGHCLLDVSVPLKPVILVTVSSFVFISLCANSSLSLKLSSPAFIIVCCSALLCALYPLISFWYRASQNELGLLIRWKLTISRAL